MSSGDGLNSDEIIEVDLDPATGEATPLPNMPAELKVRRAQLRRNQISIKLITDFLELLATTGHLYKACNASGLPYITMNRLRKDDQDFGQMVDEAMEAYRALLHAEIHRRAITGWKEPVYSQKTGERMGFIKRYDSRLLELLAKRHDPAFRDKFEGEIKITGGVLVAPAQAQTAEEWHQMHSNVRLEMIADVEPKKLTDETESQGEAPAN